MEIFVFSVDLFLDDSPREDPAGKGDQGQDVPILLSWDYTKIPLTRSLGTTASPFPIVSFRFTSIPIDIVSGYSD